MNTPLGTSISAGRSLIFCRTDAEAALVDEICVLAGIRSLLATPAEAADWLRAWGLMPAPAVFIAVRPAFTTGVRIEADRVIWMGNRPDPLDSHYAMFVQSMSRPGLYPHSIYTYSNTLQRHAGLEVM